MRVEDVSENNVKSLKDFELLNLRERANQMYRSADDWGKALRKRMVSVSRPIERDRLLESYYLIAKEVRERNLDVKPSQLDRKLFRRKVRGIDVAELPVVAVRESVVSLGGNFVTDPKSARGVDVYLDADELDDNFTFELEKRLAEMIMDQANKPVIIHRDADGLVPPVMPVYDLLLVPRNTTAEQTDIDDLRKRLESRLSRPSKDYDDGEGAIEPNPVDSGPVLEYISKPYPREHAARQLDPRQFDEFRRENNKFGPGIHAIWGIKGGKTKLQSIRFSASRFTVEQAKKWLKDHNYKTSVEPATGVKKTEADESSFIKNEEHRIVGGLVYTVGEVDAQGDFVDSSEELFKAMVSWMRSGHPMKFMHDGEGVDTPLIECFQAECETLKGGQVVPAGAWYISNYIPEEADGLWRAIKAGEIRGYSMGGSAKVEEIE